MILFDVVPEDYLTMTWPAAVGFSFTSKTWGDVLIDGLEEIKFVEATFDRLVLPPERKRILKALVRHSSDSFADIVSGKGEGSVFLLYGPPGCGKTLTAEAISEMLQRPLYSVSLGQLGTTPAELETKLGEILELCGKWDALILLDEADIFLEKRSNNSSLERNAMVSVMLRLVEYFKGVLFLTSNRVDSLDPAFKTRITLALRYEQLDKEGRNQVWLNLLDASGQGDALKEGLIDTSVLAEQPLNGREIKNAIRLAMALAKEDDKPLTQDAIMETVDILLDFNEKLTNADAY
jgi:SpoVK/Ycf46/Vps4 family AAA+-type ATPase